MGAVNRQRAIIGGMFAVALVLRLLHLGSLQRHDFVGIPGIMPDAAYNHLWATNAPPVSIASSPRAYYVSPLYCELLRGLYALLGPQPVVARTIQIFLGCLTPLIVFRLTRRFAGLGTSAVAGFIAAAYPVFIFYEATLTKESVLPLLTALAIDQLFRAIDRPVRTVRGFIPAGVVSGLLCLIRPNLMLFVVLVFAWLVFTRSSIAFKLRARAAIGWTAGIVLSIAPVAIRNWVIAGDLVLINANGGFSFYAGNVRGGDAYYRGLPGISGRIAEEQTDTRRIAEQTLGRNLKDSTISDYWYGKGREEILANWPDWVRRVWRKFLYALNDLEVPNAEHYYYGQSWSASIGLPLPSFGVLLPWAVLGAFAYRKERPHALILNLLALCVVLGLCLFYVSDRYRLPLAVVVIPYAACGLSWFWGVATRRLVVHVVWAMCLLTGVYTFTFLPLTPELRSDYSMPLINAADYFLEMDKPREARAILNYVERKQWERVELSESLGRCLLTLGEKKAAHEAIEKAIAQGPNRHQGYFLRGQWNLSDGQVNAAVSDFRKSIELKPHGGEAHYYLGALYRRDGKLAAARAELELALALNPELVPAYIECARLESLTGNPQLAVQILRTAQSRFPADVRIKEELTNLDTATLAPSKR